MWDGDGDVDGSNDDDDDNAADAAAAAAAAVVAILIATMAMATSLHLTERRKSTGSFGLTLPSIPTLQLLPALTDILKRRRALVTT